MDNKLNESKQELNKLAGEVLKSYGITPEYISPIQCEAIKTVWKLKTQDKLLCLKRLKQPYDKALFSVNAQIFIKKSGGNVPEVLMDKNKQPIVQYNDHLFVLYEWLKGRDLDFNDHTDLKSAIQGLARFHVSSKGYIPIENSRVSSKLGKWPNQYISMKNKLIEWKKTTENNQKSFHNSLYLKYIDSITDISSLAIGLLEKSDYKDLTCPDSTRYVLCHQDFGERNSLSTENGVFVIDLDGVTFDLPARDLRKIIAKQAKNKGGWDTGTITDILKWYTQINPMDEKEREILYIDLLFPHMFFGLAKNLFLKDKCIELVEIKKTAKFEQSKVSLLEELFH